MKTQKGKPKAHILDGLVWLSQGLCVCVSRNDRVHLIYQIFIESRESPHPGGACVFRGRQTISK